MKKLIHLCLLFYAFSLQAQDPMLIQFQNQKLELNPAYGGHSGPGSLHLAFAKRTSFFPVRGPFNYTSAAVDFSPCFIKNIGLGVLLNNEVQGDGLYSRTRAGINLAYGVALNDNNSLFFGIRPGFVHQVIDWNEFTFPDQLDPMLGITQPSFYDQKARETSTTPNIDAGIKYNRYKNGKPQFMLGISGFNLIEPEIGLLTEFTLKRRISVHGSVTYGRNTKLYHRTSLRADFQNNNYLFAINQELLIENKLTMILGASSPVHSQFTKDVSMFFASVGLMYQPVQSLSFYFAYENNGRGKMIRGRTSSFEIGIILKSFNSFCKGFGLKEAFDFNPNKKIIQPMECPSFYQGDKKIKSF